MNAKHLIWHRSHSQCTTFIFISLKKKSLIQYLPKAHMKEMLSMEVWGREAGAAGPSSRRSSLLLILFSTPCYSLVLGTQQLSFAWNSQLGLRKYVVEISATPSNSTPVWGLVGGKSLMLQFLKKLDIFALPLAILLKCIACLIDINFLSHFSIFFLLYFPFQFTLSSFLHYT